MYKRTPEFLVRYSPAGNGKNHWKITGYLKGRREVHWFREERDAKEEAFIRNAGLVQYGAEAGGLTAQQRYDAAQALDLLQGSGISLSLTEAVRLVVAEHKRLTDSKPFAVVIDECLKLYERRLAKEETSLANLKNIKVAGKRIKETFGETIAARLTKPEIIEWMDKLELGAVSKNFYRQYFGMFCAFGVERGYMRENPTKGIKKLGQEGEIGILSVDECKGLLQHAPRELVPYYALGLFAGLRPLSEIQRMAWEEIDWTDQVIKVQNWKTGRTRSARYRYVSMSQNLLAWLDPYRDASGPIWPKNWEKLHTQAKIDAKIAAWPFDGMRHTYASNLFAVCEHVGKVASQMGHSSPQMIFKHYRRLVKKAEAIQFWHIFPEGWIPAVGDKTPVIRDEMDEGQALEEPAVA
jgi:integrase